LWVYADRQSPPNSNPFLFSFSFHATRDCFRRGGAPAVPIPRLAGDAPGPSGNLVHGGQRCAIPLISPLGAMNKILVGFFLNERFCYVWNLCFKLSVKKLLNLVAIVQCPNHIGGKLARKRTSCNPLYTSEISRE